jgi:hypothetical protein
LFPADRIFGIRTVRFNLDLSAFAFFPWHPAIYHQVVFLWMIAMRMRISVTESRFVTRSVINRFKKKGMGHLTLFSQEENSIDNEEQHEA